MRLKTVILGAAAASLATAPIVAQAADRATASVEGESALGSPESVTKLLGLVLIAAVIIAGIEVFGDDEPASP
jgi:hypothetical protein